MINPFVIIGALIIVCTAVYTHHIDNQKLLAYKTKIVAVAEKAKMDSQLKAHAMEMDAQSQQNLIVKNYEQKLQELSHKYNTTLRAYTNAHRLHSTCASTNDLPSTTSRSARANAPRESRFSAEDTQFLISEAHRTDELIAKITALQQLVKADRAMITNHP